MRAALPASPLPRLSLLCPPPGALRRAALLLLYSLLLTHVFNPLVFRPAPAPAPATPPFNATRAAEVRLRLDANLPSCAAAGPARSFLLVFMGHSGSTALITALQQHSAIHVDALEPVDQGRFLDGPPAATAPHALAAAEAYFRNGSTAGKIPGFKLRPRHVIADPAGFAGFAARHASRIVWSFRANMLKQALGDYAIHRQGHAAGFEGRVVHDGRPTGAERSSMRVDDLPALHRYMVGRVRGDRQIARALQLLGPDGCVLPVSYESFLRMPRATLARVQRFLGLGVDEMHAPLRAKATRDAPCELVRNWDEVCQAFFPCHAWRWMLDDFDNGCSCAALRPSRFADGSRYCSTVSPASPTPPPKEQKATERKAGGPA